MTSRHYKAIVINIALYWQKIDAFIKGIESPLKYSQCSLTKEQKKCSQERTVFSTNCAGTISHPHAKTKAKQKNKPRHGVTPFIKINSK